MVGQIEAGGETGRPHIQAYGNWSNKIRFGALKRYALTVNLREVKIDNGVRDYCMKEDTRVAGPWEFGKIPVRRNSKQIGMLACKLLRRVNFLKFLLIL